MRQSVHSVACVSLCLLHCWGLQALCGHRGRAYGWGGARTSRQRGVHVVYVMLVFLVLSGRKTTVTSATETDCKQILTSPGSLASPSQQVVKNYNQCEYDILAPRNTYIVLNFTVVVTPQSAGRHGAVTTAAVSPPGLPVGSTLPSSRPSVTSSQTSLNNAKCLPKVDVVEVAPSGTESAVDTVCAATLPHVFQSRMPRIKLIYSWEPGQRSGFNLTFAFHKWPSEGRPCEFKCANGACLHERTLVCNAVANCLDSSDEDNCLVTNATNHFIEVLVIVIVVVFTLGVVVCVLVHYRLSTRLWRDRHHDSSSTEHNHLHTHTPQSTEVMYVPGRPMDRLEREVAWQRERQKLRHGVQTDTELNLPPAIPISDDGEEGYAHSQRVLQLPTCEGKGGGIRPPPNKTIFQGESPPAYRSNSVSGIDRRPRRAATPSGCGLQQLSDCGSSSPLIARCHSMSCDKSGGGSSPHSLNNPQHMNNNNNKFKVTVPPSVHVASHHGNTHGNVSNLHSAHLPMTTTMAPGHQHHHPHHHHPADPPRHHALPPHYMHSHLYCTAPQPLSEPLPHPSTAPDSRTPTPHNNSSINNGHTKTTHNPSARPGGV